MHLGRGVTGLGDLDLVVGSDTGELQYFENDGGTITERTGGANPFDSIDVGTKSAPVFVDHNGDGAFDLVVGNGEGVLKYFENQL